MKMIFIKLFLLFVVFIIVNCSQIIPYNDNPDNKDIQKLDKPEFSIAPGTYNTVINLDILHKKSKAIIYYTIDGTTPTNQSIEGKRIIIDKNTTVKVKAVCTGYNDSDELDGQFNITLPVSPIIFSIKEGYYTKPINISIYTLTEGAKIYYTLDGTIPTENSLSIANGGIINISTTTTIKAIAKKAGLSDPPVVSAAYIITGKVSNPKVSVVAGSYASFENIIFSCDTIGNIDFFYTLDGTEPSVNGIKGASVIIDHTCTLRVIAKCINWDNSDIIDFKYEITGVVAPVISNPSPGLFSETQNVILYSNTNGVTIYYTTDGSTPTVGSLVYTNPIPVSVTTTITAFAYRQNWTPSSISTFTFKITGKLNVPIINIESGTYNNIINVVINRANGDTISDIYYTIDGSNPQDKSNPNRIKGTQITISKYCILKSCAETAEWVTSDVVQREYKFKCITPQYDLSEGEYPSTQNLKITSPDGSPIYYTTDSSDPFLYGLLYNGNSITIDRSMQVKACSKKDGWTSSDVITRNYSILNSVSYVVFSLSEGVYKTQQTLNLSCLTPDVTIYYSYDNNLDILNNGVVYTVPISINNTTKINAIAVKNNIVSIITSKSYIITGKLTSPLFSETGTTLNNDFTVSFSSNQTDAIFYYTTDGTDPKGSLTRLIGNSILVNKCITFKVYCEKLNWDSSDVSSITYNLQTAAPVADYNPTDKSFYIGNSINFSTTTSGALIYYTVDGSDPVNSLSRVQGNIVVFSNEGTYNVKAVAIKNGYNHEIIFNKIYTVYNNTVKAPVSSLPVGAYYGEKTILIDSETTGANIYYTINTSNTPTDPGEPAVHPENRINSKNIILSNGNHWINAQAEKGGAWSSVTPLKYEITNLLPMPVVKVNDIEVNGTKEIAGNLIFTMEVPDIYDTDILYTLDDSYPVSTSQIYTGPVTIEMPVNPGEEKEINLLAISRKTGWSNSSLKKITFKIHGRLSTVSYSPDNTQALKGEQEITLSNPLSDTSIYYTILSTALNETQEPLNPDKTSTHYMSPFKIGIGEEKRYVIKAIAYKDNWMPSSIVTIEYIVKQKCKNPYIAIPPLYISKIPVEINLACDTPGAKIYWKVKKYPPEINVVIDEDYVLKDTNYYQDREAVDNKINLNMSFSGGIIIHAEKDGFSEESDPVDIGQFNINLYDTNQTIQVTGCPDIMMSPVHTEGVNILGISGSSNDEIDRSVFHKYKLDMSFTEITNIHFASVMNWGMTNNIIDVVKNSLIVKPLDSEIASYLTNAKNISQTTFEDQIILKIPDSSDKNFVNDSYTKQVSGGITTYIMKSLDSTSLYRLWKIFANIDYVPFTNKNLYDLSNGKVLFDGSIFYVNAGDENRPVNRVNWYGSIVFCNILSKMKGFTPVYDNQNLDNIPDNYNNAGGYRLPTEAEFEIAAKGVWWYSKYTYGIYDAPILSSQANYSGSLLQAYKYDGSSSYSDQRLFGFGLADILGNVREWVVDWYSSSLAVQEAQPLYKTNINNKKVVKGGGYSNTADDLRCSKRDQVYPDSFNDDIGFRIVRYIEDVYNDK